MWVELLILGLQPASDMTLSLYLIISTWDYWSHKMSRWSHFGSMLSQCRRRHDQRFYNAIAGLMILTSSIT